MIVKSLALYLFIIMPKATSTVIVDYRSKRLPAAAVDMTVVWSPTYTVLSSAGRSSNITTTYSNVIDEMESYLKKMT
ncbi:hypothetical protein TYRP_020371 [Tyrophagus putrescentiae]|nr:hypothetical protein TYRP_020371 [Tyrophagus putrescentiae]